MKCLFLALSCLLLAACHMPMTPQQQAFLEELANRPVTCSADADCTEKWSRAIQWVNEHSRTGIKTLSDTLIQTNKMSNGERHGAIRYPEFTVIKYASGKKSYTFNFTSYCEHGFACNPSAIKVKAGFVTFVMGLPDGVTSPEPGVFQKKY